VLEVAWSSFPPHSLAPKEATEPLYSFSLAQTSLELRPQRLPLLGAAARLAAGHLRPQLRPKPAPSHPSTTPRASPANPAAGPRRISAGAAPTAPQGPHCKEEDLFKGLTAKG
jgi:hypothetical protein